MARSIVDGVKEQKRLDEDMREDYVHNEPVASLVADSFNEYKSYCSSIAEDCGLYDESAYHGR